jgi:uncharacterized membrane protein YkvA (DUF1232 family)
LTVSARVRNVTIVNRKRVNPGRFTAIWRYLKNPTVPKLPKLFLLFAVAYVVMPIDLIPDYLVPLFGWLDDVGVATFAMGWIAKKAAEEQERVNLLTEGGASDAP